MRIGAVILAFTPALIGGTEAQAQGFNPRTPSLSSQVVNATPNQTGIFAGAAVVLSGSNLSNASISVSGQQATILNSNPNQVTFQVPFGLQPGPAVLRFSNGIASAGCAVTGQWFSAYDGATISISSQLDLDHLVALAEPPGGT